MDPMFYGQLPATDAARRADIGMMLALPRFVPTMEGNKFRLHVRLLYAGFDETAPPGDQRSGLIEGSRCPMLNEHSV